MTSRKAALAGTLALLALAACGTPTSTATVQNPRASTAKRTPPATAPPATAAPTTSATSPTTTPASPQATGVAAGLTVTSVTFVSSTEGWVLGSAACGRKPGNSSARGTAAQMRQARCSKLEHTTDGGSHWSTLTTPPGSAGQVRFANSSTGYAFGATTGDSIRSTDLHMTTDGGESWTGVTLPSDGGGNFVQQLEIARGTVWAENGVPYPEISHAPVGSTTFTDTGTSGNRFALLAVQDHEAYIPGPEGAGPILPNLEIATTQSITKPAPVPCRGVNHAIGDIGGLTPLPTAKALVLTRTSTDVFAACLNGNLDEIHLGTDAVTTSLGGSGFTFVGFTDNTHGVAISGTGNLTNGQPDLNDHLYLTTDAGRHWVQAKL